MPVTLIIVESPAKTRTLRGFLGPGYRTEATMGHIRDLPENRFAVDVEHDFKPQYVIIPGRREAVKRLKEAVKKADRVLIASDPDREGEAIAFHVSHVLGIPDAQRIEFNEITQSAVLAALQRPRPIDMRRVEAQEARRILDRLVGYQLSPLLWRSIRKGLSAGRVQSVVLRLICDREREIQAFQPEEYWSVTARLSPKSPEPAYPFEARLIQRDHRKIELKNEADARAVVDELREAAYHVQKLTKKDQRRNPAAPFTTSTLQQDAARRLGFSNRKTMLVAQQLYEGVELGSAGSVGLITYMRSDSVRVAPEAQAAARTFIRDRYGEQYLPKSPPRYRTKSTAQDAHEAIRPTYVERTPQDVAPYLDRDQQRLYELIWKRFVASQMVPAIFEVTTADIAAGRYTFRAAGSVLRFDGFLRAYEGEEAARALTADSARDARSEEEPAEGQLPPLSEGQELDLLELIPKQHFTEPPPRYTEATLVKTLDEKGIGRPSTWATFISTILDRGYVVLEDRKFKPTELGFRVNDLLVQHFPTIMDYDFTSTMETRLDDIEQGKAEKVPVLRDFYGPFLETLRQAEQQLASLRPKAVETDVVCPVCGRKMMLRHSERGEFLGCSGFPRCRTMLNVDGTPLEKPASEEETTDQVCPKCGKPMVVRQGKYGAFLGCSGYPKCRTVLPLPGAASADSPQEERTGVLCPLDGGEIVIKKSRRGAIFYGCANYPTCKFATWHRPIGRPCPKCGWPLGEKSYRKKPLGVAVCTNPDCTYSEKLDSSETEAGTAPEND